MSQPANYLYEPLPVALIFKPVSHKGPVLRFWFLATLLGLLLEFTIHQFGYFELPVTLLDLPLKLPLFPSLILGVVFTLTIGLGWGLISTGISALLLGVLLKLAWWQTLVFGIPWLSGLALISLCYQTISIGYQPRTLSSIVFYIFVCFLAATFASVAAIVLAIGSSFTLPAVILGWESWWIAVFLQTAFASGFILLATTQWVRQIKSKLLLERLTWKFPGELKVFVFIAATFLVIIGLLLLLNYFNGLSLKSTPLPIYLNSIRLVHWIIFLFIQILGYLIYHISRKWINAYRLERLEHERSMKTKHMNLAKTDLELRKANQELKTFLYRTSHDIQGPLASILGLTEVANLEITDRNSLELFNRIRVSSTKLQKKIQELVDVVELREDQLKRHQIDFSDVILHVIEDMDLIEGADQVDISVNNSNLLPFYSDPSLIKSIFQNTLTNSIDYRSRETTNSKVKIDVIDSASEIKIIVTDNGMGIDDKHKHRVFDMFYRATEISKGSGLGLYMVKSAVDKLGGKVSLTSVVGKGTRVLVLLPPLPEEAK